MFKKAKFCFIYCSYIFDAFSAIFRSLLGIYDPNHPNDPDYLAIIASNWGQKHYPAWYFNLKANPNATGVINGSTYSYLSREASGAEYDKFWQTASKMYIGFPRYKERASNLHIPIMILTAMPKT